MFNYKSISDLLEIASNKNEAPFILVLDGIEDPHNFGAILRTAEAAGVHGVIIRKNRQVQVNETVVRVSTGTAQNVAVARVPNIAQVISVLQDKEIVVTGVEIDGKRDYNNVDLKGPTALVIGSEGAGLSRLVKERCDEVVRIPMRGTVNSLNASVAAGISIFEVLRQRSQ
ncbi:MAG: 23S rRNA (guanosine(2251)-2'-O)-methyltransferase RlmB [Candidatus Margulisiibacteriota bacterium]|nr:23S rRNA (guanosine(2251)-2'-O)-methyltransferase RlmB [Candidatus Margulisiibacteriota bacterium]